MRPVILFIVHSWGGGTIRFATELAELIADRAAVVWASGKDNKTFHISKSSPDAAEQSFALADGLDAPLRALQALKPSRVNVIHTVGSQQSIAVLLERLGAPYDVTFTDYHHFSPRPHFEDDAGRFIGDAAVAAIARAAGEQIPPLLRRAERRIAVSADLARRIGPFMPGLPVIPVRIFDAGNAADTPVKIVPLADGEAMRVLVLGRMVSHKGLQTIFAVARRAQRERLPIEIISLGGISPQVAAMVGMLPRLRALGAYRQQDLGSIIAGLKPHLAWFPFTQPETHSYAISDAMSFGLPVLAAGIGAVAERLNGRPSTWIVPFERDQSDGDRHFQWLERLYRERLQTPPQYQPVDHLPAVVENFYPDVYLQPLSR